MEKIEPGYTFSRLWEEKEYIVEFDPTQVSIFKMSLTGGIIFTPAPPDTVDYYTTSWIENQRYQSLFKINELL